MGIKRMGTSVPTPTPTYPYVGKKGDVTVLFVAKKTGRALDGRFADDWLEELFTPINATIEFDLS